MNYYKILPCDEYEQINQGIWRWIKSQGFVDTTKEFWNPVDYQDFLKQNPRFVRWALDLNLKIKSIAVTVAKKDDCCPTHIDTPPARFKLSWPIANTQNTYTRWLVPTVSDPSKNVNKLGGTHFYDYTQFQEVSRLESVVPAIIDAGVPHDVVIGPEAVFPRVGLQCQLYNEPENL